MLTEFIEKNLEKLAADLDETDLRNLQLILEQHDKIADLIESQLKDKHYSDNSFQDFIPKLDKKQIEEITVTTPKKDINNNSTTSQNQMNSNSSGRKKIQPRKGPPLLSQLKRQ